MIQLPRPPIGLDDAANTYLLELVLFLEDKLNTMDQAAQKKGDPVILPQVTVADITANPGRYRAGQQARLVYVTDASVSGAVAIGADDYLGSPVWREITVGGEVGP